MSTIAEKLGIEDEVSKLQKEGFNLYTFEKIGIVDTDGDLELKEWVDSFVKPFDNTTFNRYSDDPKKYLDDAVRDLNNLFLGSCKILKSYARGFSSNLLSNDEKCASILMALHFTFTASGIMHRYDRLLESKDSNISPLAKTYSEINNLIIGLAEKLHKPKEWATKYLSILLTYHEGYDPPHIRILHDLKSLIDECPEIIEYIKEDKEITDDYLLSNLKKISDKYYIEYPYLLQILKDEMESNFEFLGIYEIKKGKYMNEWQNIISIAQDNYDETVFENFKDNIAKLKWFIECQESINNIITKNKVSLDAIGYIIGILLTQKEKVLSCVKKEHQDIISEVFIEFENNLPKGDYYFVSTIRKLTYLLIKEQYACSKCLKIYQEEIRNVWET